MKIQPNWQHIGATLLALAPVALHLLQVVRPTWYTALSSVLGVVWLAFTRSVVIDPGVATLKPS